MTYDIKTSKNTEKTLILALVLIGIASFINCQNCPSNCIRCSSPQLCTTCDLSYYLTTKSTCNICPVNCDQCTNDQFCLSCSHHYYLNSYTGQCLHCPLRCQHCTQEYENQTVSNILCDTCILGTYLKQNSCQFCMNYCINCTNGQTCQKCTLGWFYNKSQSTSECSPCPQNCSNCTFDSNQDQPICVKCIPHYGFVSTGNFTCIKCPTNCVACNGNNCTSCDIGYFSSSNNCIPCGHNCTSCTVENTCLSCQRGYFRNQNDHCELCGKACSQCNSYQNCQKCIGSFYLSAGQCNGCPSSCVSCTSSTSCQACISYAYILKSQICTLCSTLLPHCFICEVANSCLTCSEGYYVSDGKCLSQRKGMSASLIVLIVLSSITILVAISKVFDYVGFAIYKKRQINAAQQRLRQNSQANAYIEIH